MGGEPKFDASQTLPDMRYAEVATMAGLLGIRVRVERPEDIADALDTALAADRPCVDVLTDPELPTQPPHIELDQARKLAEAMLKGDSHGGQMMKQGLKDTLAAPAPVLDPRAEPRVEAVRASAHRANEVPESDGTYARNVKARPASNRTSPSPEPYG